MTEWTGKHGHSAYANGKCKCDVCRKAGTAWMNKARSRRYAYVAKHGVPSTVVHGRSCYVNWGCRCDICKGKKPALKGQLTP